MRVVGLISGGKDSIYNLLQCISAGHHVVALANIYPEPAGKKDELDSFMFQTVGHEGIELLAEAADLPLYREPTQGKSYCKDLAYRPTQKDEVEDLHRLLARVQTETGCEAVSVGAIASDYQRTRVESVCSRLGLTSLCYLWREDQSKLLREMVQAGIQAVTVKVASMGLSPQKHLGMPIRDLEPIVTDLQKKFGVNICGEGGEYETFVLDCPFFHKKIVVEESEVVTDSSGDIAAAGYLRITKARLLDKFGADVNGESTRAQRLAATCAAVPSPRDRIAECLNGESTGGQRLAATCAAVPSPRDRIAECLNGESTGGQRLAATCAAVPSPRDRIAECLNGESTGGQRLAATCAAVPSPRDRIAECLNETSPKVSHT